MVRLLPLVVVGQVVAGQVPAWARKRHPWAVLQLLAVLLPAVLVLLLVKLRQWAALRLQLRARAEVVAVERLRPLEVPLLPVLVLAPGRALAEVRRLRHWEAHRLLLLPAG